MNHLTIDSIFLIEQEGQLYFRVQAKAIKHTIKTFWLTANGKFLEGTFVDILEAYFLNENSLCLQEVDFLYDRVYYEPSFLKAKTNVIFYKDLSLELRDSRALLYSVGRRMLLN